MNVPRSPTSVLPQSVSVLEPDIAPTVRRNGPRPYWAKNADGTPP